MYFCRCAGARVDTMGVDYCSALNCHNNKKKHRHLTFFGVPKDPDRARKWAINSRREDLMSKDVLQ